MPLLQVKLMSKKPSPEEQTLCLLLGFSSSTYKSVSSNTFFTNPTWMIFLSQQQTWISVPRQMRVPGKHYPTLLTALQAYPGDQAEYFPPRFSRLTESL